MALGRLVGAGSGEEKRVRDRDPERHAHEQDARHGRRNAPLLLARRVAPEIAHEDYIRDVGEREALMLETVKLAVELGVDINAANTDGRTAFDAARLGYESVFKFLVEKGAKPGTPSK